MKSILFELFFSKCGEIYKRPSNLHENVVGGQSHGSTSTSTLIGSPLLVNLIPVRKRIAVKIAVAVFFFPLQLDLVRVDGVWLKMKFAEIRSSLLKYSQTSHSFRVQKYNFYFIFPLIFPNFFSFTTKGNLYRMHPPLFSSIKQPGISIPEHTSAVYH